MANASFIQGRRLFRNTFFLINDNSYCKSFINIMEFKGSNALLRHRNELTERDWENAVQGLGKLFPA